MKNLFLHTAVICASLISCVAATAVPAGFSAAVERAKPSAVMILVYRSSDSGSTRTLAKAGFGSGTIISSKGIVATNLHVLNRGDYYQVVLANGMECESVPFGDGKPYLADQETDLALLKLKPLAGYSFIPAVMGDSDSLREGDWVIAIGNPYGLRHSVTCGIVSSIGRNDIGFADIEDFIQTDVPINPGNSGGPLVNSRGECVGINTAIRTVSGGYQGISFAIPSKIVENVAAELLSFGHVRRGWIGILVQEHKKLTSQGEKTTIEVISVADTSPAAAAGIEVGDYLRQVDGVPLATQGQLLKIVKNKSVGEKLSITLSRDGRLFSVTIPLVEKTVYSNKKNSSPLFGKYGIELAENTQTGDVIISSVSPAGAGLYHNALTAGDVVISLNGKTVNGVASFMKVFQKSGSRIERIEVLRGGKVYTVDFARESE